MKLIPFDLLKFRVNNGLSQKEAATAFGIGVRTWGRRERAGKIPSLWYLAIVGWLEMQRKASYMPIEVDDGYKAKTAIQRFNGEG